MFKKLCILLFMILMVACSKNTEDEEVLSVYRDKTEPQLYDYALEALRNNDYSSAVKRIEAMDTLYPFSPHSKQLQLYLIFAYFKNSDYAQGAAAAERFIHLYPRDQHVDYAYYMRGVSNFEQERGTFAKLFNLDSAWRDPGSQLQAYKDFEELTKRFPYSRYYADSLKRMIYLRNQFAQRELHIANFYMERKRYVAALERANYLIRNYGQAPQAQKALQLAKKANQALHLNQAASNDQKVLNDTYSKNS